MIKKLWYTHIMEYHSAIKTKDSGGVCACVGAGDIRELSVCSAQFSCEPKVTLKNSLSKKKKFFLKKRANKPQKDTLMNIKAYS